VPDLYFERDEHSLHSGHLLLLAHAVEHLRANPTQRVVVRACTDGTGPDDWNEVLRRERALGVVRVLRSHRIEKERIVVERCASGSEGSRDDDPRHRRVELRTR
jgi:outer membrane protein OmpA-like peptidoglycan-associated protein